MVDQESKNSRRGRPRLHPLETDGHVRVELRLAPSVARLLYDAADDTGRTVSAVGESALVAGLGEVQAM